MLTQQLAASRSEDDGRISDMSFHDETLNNETSAKSFFTMSSSANAALHAVISHNHAFCQSL